MLAAAVAYILLYIKIAPGFQDVTKPTSGAILRAQAFGTCAFLMLTFILCIGPLARLDQRFLPLLYNRRHFGVIHLRHRVYARHACGQHLLLVQPAEQVRRGAGEQHELRPLPRLPVRNLRHLRALPASGTRGHEPRFLAQVPDSAIWKAIHISVYVAYAAIVCHVALGSLQSKQSPLLAVVVGLSVVAVTGLHLVAGRIERQKDRNTAESAVGSTDEEPWVVAGNVDSVPDGRGIVVPLEDGERVAVFRYGDKLSALANVCAHQNGPLGEGRIMDGCVDLPVARLPVPARGRPRTAAFHREGRDLPDQARRPAHPARPAGQRARHLCRARAHRSPSVTEA